MKKFLKSKKLFFLILTLIIISQSQLINGKFFQTAPIEKIPSSVTTKISPSDEVEIEDEVVLGYELEQKPTNRISAKVIGVKDGDTIEVDIGGIKKIVRYIGVDTPESVDPRRPVECFGKEASNINKSLVENQIVQLEKDVSETDKYGRLLRYVYLPSRQAGIGDIFVNRYLVEEGFANASSYPPDVKYQEDLESSEEEARIAGRGLWNSCHTRANGDPSSLDSRLRGNDSVSDKDCSDFSTHQEAQNYFVSKGGNSTNNVDKLDGSDRDGLVCETLP